MQFAQFGQMAEKASKRFPKEEFEKVKEQMMKQPYEGKDMPFSLKFSMNGNMLFASTSAGIQAFEWELLKQTADVTPKPYFHFSFLDYYEPYKFGGENLDLDAHRYSQNPYSYDLDIDEDKKLLLFSNINGSVGYVNLANLKNGILLEIPEHAAIWKIGLSPRRDIFAISTCFNNHRLPGTPRVQLWNYQKLLERVDWE
jgi:hypothetical protein